MTGSNGSPLITDAKLKQLYAAMLHRRLLAEHSPNQRRATARFEDALGQEALTTGWIIDLRPGDTLAPSTWGANRLSDLTEHFTAVTAAGAAHKRRKKNNVVLVFAGVSTSALACWNKALKQAVKRRLPIIFVVENNPWSTTSGSKSLQEEESVTQTARRYGLPAITVDGNDVVAVYRVACESLERVRQGDGPVLVEGKTYRAAGHRTSRDPLVQMERYLTAKKLFTSTWKKQLKKDFSRERAAERF